MKTRAALSSWNLYSPVSSTYLGGGEKVMLKTPLDEAALGCFSALAVRGGERGEGESK